MRTTAIELLAALTIGASAHAYTDAVVLGNAASEDAHALRAVASTVATGGLGESCRRIGQGGSLVFDLKCDPTAQNYLTVKFWGSDTDPGVIFLFDGEKRIGNYLDAWPELDLGVDKAAFPGRFYYSTYLIPRGMTDGKQSVTLTLAAVGGIFPYAPPDRRERPLTGLTRGLYRAYSHTDPFLSPGNDEAQGQAPAPQPGRPASDVSPVRLLQAQADEAVNTLLRWQLYGPEWAAAFERGEAPAVLNGAVCRPLSPSRKPADEWKDTLAKRVSDGNATALNILAIFAHAYRAEWSRLHRHDALLDRIVAGLDFCCAAQGANGGFHTAKGWVGGPRRKPTGSCLEGFGTAAIGEALIPVHRELEAKELLDKPLDPDGDPSTPPVSRRAAYVAMLEKHRDFLASEVGRGHATNQDLAQMTALWLANESLRLLSPSAAWLREKALEFVHAAVGLGPDPLGGFWVTRKGLALEPWGTLAGGYCGNYGLSSVRQICRLAELTGDPVTQQRALAAVHAAAHFVAPALDDEGRTAMRREEVISTRNNHWPGRVDFGGDEFTAAALKDPLSIRALQLAADQGHPRTVLEPSNAHFVDSVASAMRLVSHYATVLALPPSPARLSMEPGQPDYAWADEQAGVVLVKDRGARLYVSLNWRRGFKDGKRDPQHTQVNNIARVHHTTPTVDRIASVVMESPRGFGKLYLCRFGPYLVGMNLTDTETYQVPIPPDLRTAVDLVSGQTPDATKPLPIPPGTTRVLRLSAPANAAWPVKP